MHSLDSLTPTHPHTHTLKLGRVLVVDDETELMTALCDRLEKRGYEAAGFSSGEEALPALREQDFDVLLTDLMMPGMDGITLLRAGLEVDPNLVGIIMTGQGTVQTAVEAMKVGAFDYVLKPFKLEALLPVLARAMDVRRLRLENVQLRETVAAYELSKAISLTLDSRTLLHKVADAALQQCEADEVSLLLPTPEGDEFYLAVVRGGQREHLVGERAPRDAGVAGWVAQHHEPLLLHGEVQDPRFAPLHPRPDIHSAISMPLLVGNKLVGVLNVNATRPRRPFTLGQVKALTLLTSTAAAALEAAGLHEDLQRAYDDLRRTQQAVLQQERLRALGQMASGIAHDINNALSPIVGYASLLLNHEPNLSDRAREYLEHIHTAGRDIAHIVERMREFYRPREEGEPLFPVPLNPLVEQVLDLTRPRWKDIPQERGVVVDILTDLQPNLPPVTGAESEIREALTNLILNAVDAMPEGGRITIRTSVECRVTGDECRVTGDVAQSVRLQGTEQTNSLRHTAAEPTPVTRHPSLVTLSVSDTGHGMDEETRQRCLDPFYSTKGQRGTGLGLPMVYGVMQRHDGEVEIESEVGQGTTVRLVFPVPTAVGAGVSASPQAVAPLSPLRILCVDDEPLLRDLMQEMLEADGHTVEVAEDGPAGLEIFRTAQEQGEPFEVVITDLGMPYMDGREVTLTVKEESPTTPVIMLTGWGTTLRDEGHVPQGVDVVLSKPPELNRLREALVEVMG